MDESTEPKIIELSYNEKVPVIEMKKVIRDCLSDLTDQVYDVDKCNALSRSLADKIREGIKSIRCSQKYKFVVQVLIGERRDQGVHFGTRSFWDSNTDNYASDSFTNVSSIYYA